MQRRVAHYSVTYAQAANPHIFSVLRKIPFIKPMAPTVAKLPPEGSELDPRGQVRRLARPGAC